MEFIIYSGHKNELAILSYKHIRYGMKVVMHLIFHEHKQTVKSRLINFQIKQSYKITALTHLQLFGLNSRNLTNCQVLVPNTPNPNPGDGSGANTKITRLQAGQWINGAVIVFHRRPRRLGEREYLNMSKIQKE